MSATQPMNETRVPSRRARLEMIIATVDELLGLADVGTIAHRVARGFCDIGAVMNWLLVSDGESLQALARWPIDVADALYAKTVGGNLLDFRVSLERHDHPYVQVLRRGEPRIITGDEAISQHLSSVYGVDLSVSRGVIGALSGRASAVVPLIAGDQPLGVAAINYPEDLEQADLDLFDIYARSTASMLQFKRDVVGRERILQDLAAALEAERTTRLDLNRAERLAALGEMAAVVAHEIRNPLAIIKNSYTSLKRHVVPSPEAALLQRIVSEETERIGRIIDDLLVFASPTHDRRGPVDVRELVTRAVFLAQEQCEPDQPMRVHERLEGPLPRVWGDADGLTRAIVNLLFNAHQACESASIEVAAEEVRSDDLHGVRLVVSDRGPGIPAAERERVFEPFFTTRASGTGLGLTIIKRIIDAHGGRIDLDSREGEGTRVTLLLPAFDGQA